jgi:anti-sigma factor RsiW
LPHERPFELLPWFVNGTLKPAERDAFEQHARTCIACRLELKEQQRLQAAVRAQPAVHLSAQAGLEQLDRALADGTPTRGARRFTRRYAALRPFALATAAGVALVAFLLWLTPLPQPGGGPYTTLATPPVEAPLVDVVFARDTTADEITALLADVGGEIVAGPSEVGRYTVRIGGDSDVAEVDGALATLSADTRVRFVGRSFATPSR